MKLVAIIPMLLLVTMLSANAENGSISKERPQADEIKHKTDVKLLAKLEAKKAEKLLEKHNESQREIVRTNTVKKDVKKITELVSAMPDMAKEQRKQLEKIRSEIDKKTELKKLKIENLVKKSDIGKPSKEKKTIQYKKN